MKRDNRRFGRGGVYECRVCHKQTRETGDGESGVELCARCFELSGQENAHVDGCHEATVVDTCPLCHPFTVRYVPTAPLPAVCGWCHKAEVEGRWVTNHDPVPPGLSHTTCPACVLVLKEMEAQLA